MFTGHNAGYTEPSYTCIEAIFCPFKLYMLHSPP